MGAWPFYFFQLSFDNVGSFLMFDFLAHINLIFRFGSTSATRMNPQGFNRQLLIIWTWMVSPWAGLQVIHTFRPGADVTPSWCMRSKKKSTRSKTAVFTSGFTVRMTTKHKETLYWEWMRTQSPSEINARNALQLVPCSTFQVIY